MNYKKGGTLEKLLYEYQADYKDKEILFYDLLNDAEELVGTGILTLKEFLDLGFNNSKLLKKDDSNWIFDTGYKNVDKVAEKYGTYFDTLTEDMLNIKVISASDAYEDLDGYYCIDLYCVNSKDYELFDKVLEQKKEHEL